MQTKEPSQQVTPLSEEPAGFPPAPTVRDELTPPPAPRHDPWAPWLEVLKAFMAWALSVGMLIFIPVLVALPYIIYSWVQYGPPRPEALATDKSIIFYSIVGILPAHLLTLGMAWLFVTGGGKRPFFRTLGFYWPKNITPLTGTLVCALLALVLLGIGYAVTKVLGGDETQLDMIVKSSTAARIATALVAVVTAPLVEEVIYRGMIYSALERAAGKWIGIIIVSLLFAGVHVFQYLNNIGVILVITILSFSLTFARAYSGSLLPPFIIHLVFNGIQSLFIMLGPLIEKNIAKSEPITPTAPGLEVAVRFVESIVVHVCRMT